MRCETKLCTSYGITGPKKEYVTPLRTTRPVRSSADEKCWQFKALHIVTFEYEQDYDDIFKALNRVDQAGINYSGLTEEEVLGYISHKYFADKKLVVKKGLGSRLYRWKHNYHDQMSISFYLEETAKEITKPSQKEEEHWAKLKEIEVNDKLITAFFKDNLQSMLKKYGLSAYKCTGANANIYFESSKAFIEFVNKAIEDTVIKELKEMGLTATVDKTFLARSIKGDWIASLPLLQAGIIVDQKALVENTALQ